MPLTPIPPFPREEMMEMLLKDPRYVHSLDVYNLLKEFYLAAIAPASADAVDHFVESKERVEKMILMIEGLRK